LAGGTRKDGCILWLTEGSLPKNRTNTRTKGRANRGRPATRQRREWPILPLSVGGIFSVAFVVLIVLYYLASRGGTGVNGQPVANIRCESGEQLSVHYHAHVSIIYKGQPAMIPGQVGITSGCFYWMHTHATTGIVHIEAPKDSASRTFTLSDFFAVWNQPLSDKQVATFKVGSGDQLKMWVDGKPYTGDIRKIPLKTHTDVVVEIGPPFTDPPPTYDWNSAEATQEAGTGG